MLKEWPLVAFTILGQTAVGILLAMGLPWIVMGTSASTWTGSTTGIFLAFLGIIFGLLALAAGLSFFHLHHPFRALRVLANLGTSWLSREILFELTTMAFVLLMAGLIWAGIETRWLLKTVMGMACASGLMFLFSMVRLYRLPTLPVWGRLFTPFSFALTTLSMGTLITALIWRAFAGPRLFAYELLDYASLAVLFEIGFVLIRDPLHGLRIFRPVRSLRPPERVPRGLLIGRLTFLGLGLFLLLVLQKLGLDAAISDQWLFEPEPGPVLLHLGAVVLVLAAEAAGRFLFYGLVPRPGD